MLVALTGGADTFSGLLSIAGDMFAWFLTQMGNLVTFVTSNPIVLAGFIIMLCGAVVGMFMRIWKSA